MSLILPCISPGDVGEGEAPVGVVMTGGRLGGGTVTWRRDLLIGGSIFSSDLTIKK